MPHAQFVCPVKHLLGFVGSCTVPLRRINSQHSCIPPVPILDDGDMVWHMAALPLKVPFVQGVDERAQDHSGVTSTIIPPFGYRSTTYFFPGSSSEFFSSSHHAISRWSSQVSNLPGSNTCSQNCVQRSFSCTESSSTPYPMVPAG